MRIWMRVDLNIELRLLFPFFNLVFSLQLNVYSLGNCFPLNLKFANLLKIDELFGICCRLSRQLLNNALNYLQLQVILNMLEYMLIIVFLNIGNTYALELGC